MSEIAKEWTKFTVLHNDQCADPDTCAFCLVFLEWCRARDKRTLDGFK